MTYTLSRRYFHNWAKMRGRAALKVCRLCRPQVGLRRAAGRRLHQRYLLWQCIPIKGASAYSFLTITSRCMQIDKYLMFPSRIAQRTHFGEVMLSSASLVVVEGSRTTQYRHHGQRFIIIWHCASTPSIPQIFWASAYSVFITASTIFERANICSLLISKPQAHGPSVLLSIYLPRLSFSYKLRLCISTLASPLPSGLSSRFTSLA